MENETPENGTIEDLRLLAGNLKMNYPSSLPLGFYCSDIRETDGASGVTAPLIEIEKYNTRYYMSCRFYKPISRLI